MMKRIKNYIRTWALLHEYIVDFVKVCVVVTLIVGIFLTIIALVFAVFDYPKCVQVSQNFTGKYIYYLFNGCYIDVGDGKYFPVDSIFYVVKEGIKIIP